MFQKLILFFSVIILFSSCQGSQPHENKIIEHKKIVALGDSLTAGYGVEDIDNYPSKLQQKFIQNGYDIEIINAGISGDTSERLDARAGEYLVGKPDVAIIVIGGNDGLQGKSVADMKENIQAVISLYESQNTQVVLGGIDILPVHGFAYRSDFKNAYKDLAKSNSELHFLKSFLSGVATRAELNLADNIHPNADGYDIISENMYEFLIKNKLVEK